MSTMQFKWGEVYYEHIKRNTEVTIVFVHGLIPGSVIWYKQIEAFSDYSMLLIDLPGRGLSENCTDFSIRTSAKIIESIRIKENIENFVMVGISMGGYIVQEFAKNFGGALGYLISGSTPIDARFYFPWEIMGFKTSAVYFRATPWEELKKTASVGVTISDEGEKFMTAHIDKVSEELFYRLWPEMTNFFTYERFSFDAPILILVGEEDQMGTIKLHIDDWKNYENSEIIRIPNAAHLVNIDNAQAFNQALRAFVNKAEIEQKVSKVLSK